MAQRSFVLCVVLLAGSGPLHASGQCTQAVTTDLVAGFRAARPAAVGETQDPQRSAWSFHSGSATGPLLSGLTFNGTDTYWGAPLQPYTVPTAGPIYSPIQSQNEANFYSRPLSFTGILAHPGNSNTFDSVSVFSPENEVTIDSLSVDAEVVGQSSDGVNWSVEGMVSGAPISLIPTSAGFYSTVVAHQTFTAASSLFPITLAPGDWIAIRTDLRGSPSEDWANTNMTFTFRGGPVVLGSPRNAAISPQRHVGLTSTIVGSGVISYQWQFREGAGTWKTVSNGNLVLSTAEVVAIVTNADKATINFDIQGDPDMTQVYFRCIGSNSCHSVTTGTAQIRSCIADRNCDGVVDLNDFFDWFNCWDATSPCADIDGNGEIDLIDFFGFFTHFDASC